ncbi:MAG: hypothetical protein OXH86_07475, partial [Acidimicrobiaceae bacterium]|nr:hypothetical protein [Acidimicrobiaceae bacterium]
MDCSTADSDGSYEVPHDWALKPAGLSEGDTFRLLFITSTTRNASSSNIADYNTLVQNTVKTGHTAISDACGNLFTAVASTSAVDARANTDTESTDTDASIWWLGGNKAADNYADFYDGGWDDYGRRSESGTSRAQSPVWTGSNADGTKHTSEHMGAGSARVGQPQSGRNPMNSNSYAKAVSWPLYGLSPLFKVAASPCTTEVPPSWALTPVGLSDGDTFRLLFVTSTTRNALSSDIAVFNSFVQTRAKAGHTAISDSCGDQFKAVASTSAVDARVNTDTESSDTAASIWWLGGAKAADDYADFYDGSWDNYARTNESGASRASTNVWTGSNNDGTKHATQPLSATGLTARRGQPQSGSFPLSTGDSSVVTNYPLYGLSPVFKVAAVSCATADTTDGSYEVPHDWALKPAGLSDGDVFRLLFVSSTTRNALSSDIAVFNSFVQTRAKAGHTAISDSCGDQFKAVASTSAVDARVNTDTESSDTAASIWWLGGAKAADDYADFYDGSWDNYARTNESGASRASTNVWTGSNNDGTKHATQPLSATGLTARRGQPQSGSFPLSTGGSSVVTNYPLYGMSPLFKVEQRPTVSISATSVSAGELSTVTLQVLLSEANSSGAALVIPVRVKSAGTTLSTSEYSFTGDCDGSAAALNGTVTIGDGNLVDIGRIWLCDDDVDEPDETVTVELGTLPDGWIAGDDSEVAITVVDDDATVVSV